MNLGKKRIRFRVWFPYLDGDVPEQAHGTARAAWLVLGGR
jgi:hypothetical protein